VDAGARDALDRTVILLDDVVQVLALPEFVWVKAEQASRWTA
jgi:hypothetical protein